MSNRNLKILAGALLLLGLLAVLFLSVDFRAAESNTSTQSGISRYTAGVPQGVSAQPPRSLGLHVVGDDRLANSVKAEFARPLMSRLGLPHITLLEAMPEQENQPTLIVQVADGNVNWTPVYARAAITVRMTYASDGDMSWRDEFTVIMNTRDGEPQIRVRGDLELADTTRGMISEPAYQHHLAEQIASAVSDALRQQVSS